MTRFLNRLARTSMTKTGVGFDVLNFSCIKPGRAANDNF